jgi:hypothetical protein
MNDEYVLDIKGTGKEEQKSLSNFQNYGFVLDGVPCASMEGLLQSLKTKNIALQKEICSRSGLEAKRSFEKKWQNARWKLTGILYWQGKPIRRRSDEYQYFLDRAYDALLRYERIGTIALWVLVLTDVGDRFISGAIYVIFDLFCRVAGF